MADTWLAQMHPYEESRDCRASWCLSVGEREFSLYLLDGRTVCFVDTAAYRALRPKERFTPELRAFVGDAKAAQQIWRERQEFSLSFEVDDVLVQKWLAADAMIEKEGDITGEMEAEIDALLMPYFWSEVNPHLTEPVKK